MCPDHDKNKIRLHDFIGDQILLLMEPEFMHPKAGQVTLLFFAYARVVADTVYFILDGQLQRQGLLFNKPPERRGKQFFHDNLPDNINDHIRQHLSSLLLSASVNRENNVLKRDYPIHWLI